MNEKLYRWTFNFYKVVRQQIWGEVVGLILQLPLPFTDENNSQKNY